MNVTKFLILIIAIALAVGGILIYEKTMVAPPSTIELTDQYDTNLSKSYCLLDSAGYSLTESQRDSIFDKTLYKSNIYLIEDKIDGDTYDAHLCEVVSLYTPKFYSWCIGRFEQSTWDFEELQMMYDRIQTLRGCETTSESSPLSDKDAERLSRVEQVLNDYINAVRVSSTQRFKSVAQARSVIRTADRLAKAPYLSNCKDLMAKLRGVKERIKEAHYQHLYALINERAPRYMSYTKEYYFGTVIGDLERQVDDFEQLYGKGSTSALTLRKLLNNYRNQALTYYKQKGW